MALLPRSFPCALALLASLASGIAATPGAVPGMTPSTNEGQPIAMPAGDAAGNFPNPPEMNWAPGAKKGEIIKFTWADSKIYPGTKNNITVYIPTGYTPDKPACLLLALDQFWDFEEAVTENLTARGEMPVTILVGIAAGAVQDASGKALRYNRSYEFDSTNGNFADYLEKEILPEVQKLRTADGRPVRISSDAKDRAIEGGSTGGIGSFTVAWQRPDLFSRVFSVIGTYVSMRGGDEYPALIRKTEPKPIRIFLEDGSQDAWNPLFGSWFMANLNMEAALSFAGYDVAHLWGTHGHDGRLSNAIRPDVMRWLWKGWPAPVKAGVSNNDMLREILAPNQPWQVVADGYKSASGLASNQAGEVVFADAFEHAIYKTGAGGKPVVLFGNMPAIAGAAFGPDGSLFATVPDRGEIVAINQHGTVRTIATGIRGEGILVTSEGNLLITEPGKHSDEPGTIRQISPAGKRTILDTGLLSASGISFSPDRSLLIVPEASTKWGYAWIVGENGVLQAKQRFFRLHMTDLGEGSGARDICQDTHGNVYVATDMGIQVCDRNGRVRAILNPPTPCGSILSICFGGPGFHTLYATDGHKIFSRVLNAQGYEQWAPPIAGLPLNGG